MRDHPFQRLCPAKGVCSGGGGEASSETAVATNPRSRSRTLPTAIRPAAHRLVQHQRCDLREHYRRCHRDRHRQQYLYYRGVEHRSCPRRRTSNDLAFKPGITRPSCCRVFPRRWAILGPRRSQAPHRRGHAHRVDERLLACSSPDVSTGRTPAPTSTPRRSSGDPSWSTCTSSPAPRWRRSRPLHSIGRCRLPRASRSDCLCATTVPRCPFELAASQARIGFWVWRSGSRRDCPSCVTRSAGEAWTRPRPCWRADLTVTTVQKAQIRREIEAAASEQNIGAERSAPAARSYDDAPAAADAPVGAGSLARLGLNGRVCADPSANHWCTTPKNIKDEKNAEHEDEIAGLPWASVPCAQGYVDVDAVETGCLPGFLSVWVETAAGTSPSGRAGCCACLLRR